MIFNGLHHRQRLSGFTVNVLTILFCRWIKLVCPTVMHSVAPSKCYLTATTGAVAWLEETREPVSVADRSGWGKFSCPLLSIETTVMLQFSETQGTTVWQMCGACVCGLCLNLYVFLFHIFLHIWLFMSVRVCAHEDSIPAFQPAYLHTGMQVIIRYWKSVVFSPHSPLHTPLSMNKGVCLVFPPAFRLCTLTPVLLSISWPAQMADFFFF